MGALEYLLAVVGGVTLIMLAARAWDRHSAGRRRQRWLEQRRQLLLRRERGESTPLDLDELHRLDSLIEREDRLMR